MKDESYSALYGRLAEKYESREDIFNGKVLHVVKDTVRLPDGRNATREVALHNGAVAVVPMTDDGEIIMERQFRYPFDRVLWEIPAGKIDEGETDPMKAALRELREETGYTADKIVPIGEYYASPAILSERIYLYFACGLKEGERELDEDEFLEIEKLPLETVKEMILDGQIPDGKTQMAILKADAMLRSGRLSL